MNNENKLSNAYKLHIWLAGILVIVNELIAIYYSYQLAFIEQGAQHLEVVGIFVSLTISNTILFATAYHYRDRLQFMTKVTVIVWTAIAYGFYSIGPLIVALSMIMDAKQLSVFAFMIVWEVPILGGAFLLVIWRMLHPLLKVVFSQTMVGKEKAESVYRGLNTYPLKVGMLMLIVVLFSSVLGAFQMRVFSQIPDVGFFKVILGGVLTALLTGIYMSLTLDSYFNRLRLAMREKYGVLPINRKKYAIKIFLSVTGIYIVTIGFSTLVIIKQFQVEITEIATADLLEPANIPPDIDEHFYGRVDVNILSPYFEEEEIVIYGKERFLEDTSVAGEFSAETMQKVAGGEVGVFRDTRGYLKVLNVTENSVSVIELRKYYGFIWSAVVGVSLPLFIVFSSAMFLSVFYGFSITGPMRGLGKFALDESNIELHKRYKLYSGDEIEEFANTISYYRAKSGEFTKELEKKVNEKTRDLNEKIFQIEEQNKALEDTKRATLNILEDSQELQEELKRQKESVELQVTARTRDLKEKTEALQKAKDEISSNWVRLQEEKARLTSSINSLPYGFLLTDSDGAVISANKKLHTLLGLPTTAIGINVIQDALEGNFDLEGQILTTISSGRPSEVTEISIGDKYLTLSAFPIISQQEERSIGAVVLIQDVTEKKVLERSRDEFFSIASHELRTPLTAIRGNTSLIKEYFAKEIKDPQLLEMINDIYDSSTRLIDIVNDFLDVSRLEQKRIEFEKTDFDISELIEKVAYELKGIIDTKGIYLKMDHTLEFHPHIYADKNRTKQILYNLIGNATKFTDKGGITVSCQPNGKMLEVRISDTGRGIPLQSQPLLFRKFQQAGNNNLTRDTTRGTGMGLYISRLLAKGMGGDIVLEKSQEEVGSTFMVTFPLFTTDQAIPQTSQS